ncbi:HPt (histidine-containing phosphotransfer) domain-containing protein [Duganella sp. CF517]|uniref:Hpt domain-containing protein n=1 Tax=Duganella sp. CF517 TaxID=1881038 RepID=UPI0008B05008|nr:Hpt domain-containing protein [Duganella sp. CF517]SEO52431.1 HPt (histidine-containing phosphotransfer) domain-containing protein [Duganella sp. CF517]
MSARYGGIDPDVLWCACGADRDAFQALSRIFLASAPPLLERLLRALEQGRAHEAGAASHALKGMTQLVGAAALSAALQRCERAAADGAALPAAAPLTAQFALVMDEVAHSLVHYAGAAP